MHRARIYSDQVALEQGPLAGIPATIERLLARLVGGDSLVTLRYAEPVVWRGERVSRSDVRRSEVR